LKNIFLIGGRKAFLIKYNVNDRLLRKVDENGQKMTVKFKANLTTVLEREKGRDQGLTRRWKKLSFG
jgi:hypothetical protein